MIQPLLVVGIPMSPQVTVTPLTFEHGGGGGVTPNGTALKQVALPLVAAAEVVPENVMTGGGQGVLVPVRMQGTFAWPISGTAAVMNNDANCGGGPPGVQDAIVKRLQAAKIRSNERQRLAAALAIRGFTIRSAPYPFPRNRSCS